MSAPQPLTGDELATIKARAEAATPGPWIIATRRDGAICGIDNNDGMHDVVAPGDVACGHHCLGGTSTVDASAQDWRHIAGMDPETTLRLVAEVERLRAQVAELDTWPDGNRKVPGESFDDYSARMIHGIQNIPDDQLARHPDGTLDTEPACWCHVPALLAHVRCPRHLGYYP